MRAMGKDESSGVPPPICISIELQLSAGQIVELSGAELRYDIAPLLDGHFVNTKSAGDGSLSFEVPDSVSFEHGASISPLYSKHNTVLQPYSYPDSVETMGERIKMLRHSKGWTQQQLGDLVGVSKVAVYQWEVGTTSEIKLRTFLKLVEALGTNTHYLLFGAEAPRTQPRKRSQS